MLDIGQMNKCPQMVVVVVAGVVVVVVRWWWCGGGGGGGQGWWWWVVVWYERVQCAVAIRSVADDREIIGRPG